MDTYRTHGSERRATAALLALSLLSACAVGLDPLRAGSGGEGTGATTSSGLSSTSSTGTGGGVQSSSSSSTTSSAGSTSSTSSTSTSSTSSTSTSSTSSTSTSGAPPAGLAVQYLCAATAATVSDVKPHLQVVNNGTTAVDLTTLTARYYYTKDGSPATDQAFACDYALLGCGLVSVAFNTTTGNNADEYAELSFLSGAGMLQPGASTGEIQVRIHPADYQYMFTQTNDYSFDATKLSYAYWSNVTLYQNGTLVWGTEP